jgi:menaquinone-specific isochorismate synthase
VGSLPSGARLEAPDRLAVTTVAVSDPGDLTGRLPGPDPVAWIRRGDGLAGWGAAAAVTLPAGADRFAAAEKWLRELFDGAAISDEVGVPGTGPVAFGSFTFDPASDGSVLVVPEVLFGRRHGRAWMTIVRAGSGGPPPRLAEPAPPRSPAGVSWADGSIPAPRWEQAVAAAVTAIRAGRLRKVVLARDMTAVANQDLDARVVLARLAAIYPDCYAFACAGLVGATPELLISRTSARVRSLVLAGTAQRGGTAAADRALGAALLASAKDREEHDYAVADIRAALAPLCAELAVPAVPELLRLANVQHLATGVTGLLAGAADRRPSALALAAALHPTAAVCGTPAEAAMELIRELEAMDRGRYSGPVGWMDADGDGEFGIALRCGELDGPRARLFAGGGIVADSDPAAELAEAQVKFRAMQQALEG